jgi:hypothetical protein
MNRFFALFSLAFVSMTVGCVNDYTNTTQTPRYVATTNHDLDVTSDTTTTNKFMLTSEFGECQNELGDVPNRDEMCAERIRRSEPGHHARCYQYWYGGPTYCP